MADQGRVVLATVVITEANETNLFLARFTAFLARFVRDGWQAQLTRNCRTSSFAMRNSPLPW